MRRSIKSRTDAVQEMLKAGGIFESILQIDKIGAGLFNAVYRVEFEQRLPLLLRIRTRPADEFTMPFALEEQVYPLLPRNINTPRLHFVSPTLGYAVFDFVEGRTLTDIATSSEGASPPTKLLETLAVCLDGLHKIQGIEFGRLGEITHSARERTNYFERLFLRHHRQLAECAPKLSGAYERAVPRWLAVIEALPPELGAPVLLHGDLHGGNIIVQADGKPFMIDWEGSTYGIVASDLARLRLSLQQDPSWFDAFLKHYIAVAGLIPHSGILNEIIDLIECFLRCRVGLLQARFPQYRNIGIGSPEHHFQVVEQRIQKWTSD